MNRQLAQQSVLLKHIRLPQLTLDRPYLKKIEEENSQNVRLGGLRNVLLPFLSAATSFLCASGELKHFIFES